MYFKNVGEITIPEGKVKMIESEAKFKSKKVDLIWYDRNYGPMIHLYYTAYSTASGNYTIECEAVIVNALSVGFPSVTVCAQKYDDSSGEYIDVLSFPLTSTGQPDGDFTKSVRRYTFKYNQGDDPYQLQSLNVSRITAIADCNDNGNTWTISNSKEYIQPIFTT